MLNDNLHTDNPPYYRNRAQNPGKEFDLGLFFYIARKSMVWVIMFMLLAVAGSFLYLRYTQPVFEAGLVLKIGDEDAEKKVLNLSNLPEEGGIDQAIELLRSEYLFSLVLHKLPLKISYFAEGNILSENKYPMVPFSFQNLEIRDSSLCGTRIDFFFDENDFKITYLHHGQEFQVEGKPGIPFQSPHFNATVEINDPELVRRIQSENRIYIVFNSNRQLLEKMLPKLSIGLENAGAQTIKITFRDHNSVLTADVVKAVASTFDEYMLKKKNESSSKIVEYLQLQIEMVLERLKESEMQLRLFRKDNKVQNFEGVSQNYLVRLTQLEDNLLNEEIDQQLLWEVEKAVSEYDDKTEVYDMLSVLAGTRYESALRPMLTELHKLLMEREKELFGSTRQSTYIKSLDYQISIQVKLIRQAIQTVKDQALKRQAALKEKIREYELVYYGLPEKEIDYTLEYARLERMFSIDEEYHTLLVKKKAEYDISLAGGQTTKNEVLVEAKIPEIPVSPNRKMAYAAFIMLGLLASLGLIVTRYFFHNEISSIQDINRQSNVSLSVLGVIPRYRQSIPVSQLIVDKNPKSMISEAFRSIRTNLQFISNKHDAKLIAITSTISGEGKTFVAINLAGIIAYSGKKVIILDLDMRKPKIHLGFESDNDYGMSTLLIDKDNLAHCIRHSRLANLDFITAGPIPPNPSELIINGKLDVLLEELRAIYDVVIVDNPPVGLVTDGLELLRKADYPIYIFRSNYSKKYFVQNVDRLINENHLTRLSIVLNGVDTERNSFGYGGYGYGYGKGYGDYYSEEPEKKTFLARLFSRKRR